MRHNPLHSHPPDFATCAVTAVILLSTLLPDVHAQSRLALWPESGMPNSHGIAVTDSMSGERIYRLSRPEITAFRPARELNTGAAVLIFPGGGYDHLTYVLEGVQLARWMSTLGVSAFVVTYRLPHSPDLVERSIGPLQDAQRAMRLVRSRASEWNIDPGRIGVLGTSAGGHLAASLGTFHEDVYAAGDAADAHSFAPDFMVLISPVIDMGEHGHVGSRANLLGDDPTPERIREFSLQTRVTSEAPPTILFHAADDRSVPASNSMLFFDRLRSHGVSSALHIFPRGGHALLLAESPSSASHWRTLCKAWLVENGFLERD